jgi:hypothetical protein
MATVMDDLKKKKSVKFSKISASVPVDFKEKIELICKENGVKSADYLYQILKKSEIDKVYKNTIKEIKSKEAEAKNKEAVIDNNETIIDGAKDE